MNPLDTLRPPGFRKRYALLFLSFFALAYILPLGARPLIVPDETRYGEIPREMLAGGGWVVPHLNGLRYFEKPVLGYWIHAAFLRILGEHNFAVRLPSALAVGVTALSLIMLVARTTRNRVGEGDSPAVLTGLVFLSSLAVFVFGNTALLDSLFSLFLLATIVAFYLASEAPPRSASERSLLLLSGLSCGLAFLTKGFLAFAVPVLTLAPYLMWQRRYADLLRMGWLPVVTAGLVALPWAILIHWQEPDYWHFFIWNEHIRRFIGDNAQHRESFWFYLMLSPAMFVPWVFLVPAAAVGIRQRMDEPSDLGRFVRLSICWLVFPFLFFSLARGKLLTYVLPCFPPFAVLMAVGLTSILGNERRSRSFQWGAAAGAVFYVVCFFAMLFFQLFGYEDVPLYGAAWKLTMGIAVLVCSAILCVWAFRSWKAHAKVWLFGLAPLLVFFSLHFIVPDLTLEEKAPGPLLKRHRQDVGENTVVISDQTTITATCWYLRRSNVYIIGDAGELGYGLGYENGNGRQLDVASAADLIRRNPGNVVLIARLRSLSSWRDQLPQPVSEDQNGPSGYAVWTY